jgi:AcrR family transcriptional regulator
MYMMVGMPTRASGRPRDPALDASILAATRELLVEVGYAGVSMGLIAARAQVGKPTVYRRYPSKAALVFDAVFGQTKSRPLPEHGEIGADLREAYGWAVEEFASSEARAALPGLLADLSSNEQLLNLVRRLVIEPEVDRVRDALRVAQERGEIRGGVDLDLAIDAFIGTALARTILVDRPVDRGYGDALVDLLIHGLAPGPAGRPPAP